MEEPNVPVGGDQENSEGIYIGKNLNSVVDITNELQSAVDRHFDFICVPLVRAPFEESNSFVGRTGGCQPFATAPHITVLYRGLFCG